MKAFSLALLLTVALCYDFSNYVVQFNKNYHSEEQYNFRKSLFDANYTIIQQTNSQNLGYTAAVNNFTDWTYAEYNALLTGQNDDSTPVSQISEDITKVSAPVSVNWNASGKVTSVKNQGWCGSCWAFATAAAYESFLAIKTGALYDLSEEYLLECTNASSCNGGYVDYAMLLVLNGKGMPTEGLYPYKALTLSSGKPTTAGICTTTNKISYSGTTNGYKYLNLTLENVKSLVAISPVIGLFYAPTRLSSYSSGVFSCTAAEMTMTVNHFVLIVGYDSAGNLLVKNSWGAGWGQAGFFWLNGGANDCKMKAYVLRFGSSTTSSYGGKLMIAAMLLVGIVLSLA